MKLFSRVSFSNLSWCSPTPFNCAIRIPSNWKAHRITYRCCQVCPVKQFMRGTIKVFTVERSITYTRFMDIS